MSWTCMTANVTDKRHYVNECLGLKQCMLVSNCTRMIEEFVCPRFSEWIIISIYCVIFCLGLLGNGLVCFVVLKVTYMRSVVNIFILNLAIADFLVLLICLPPSVLADTTESWYLGDAMCKVVLFLQVSYQHTRTSSHLCTKLKCKVSVLDAIFYTAVQVLVK